MKKNTIRKIVTAAAASVALISAIPGTVLAAENAEIQTEKSTQYHYVTAQESIEIDSQSGTVEMTIANCSLNKSQDKLSVFVTLKNESDAQQTISLDDLILCDAEGSTYTCETSENLKEVNIPAQITYTKQLQYKVPQGSAPYVIIKDNITGESYIFILNL